MSLEVWEYLLTGWVSELPPLPWWGQDHFQHSLSGPDTTLHFFGTIAAHPSLGDSGWRLRCFPTVCAPGTGVTSPFSSSELWFSLCATKHQHHPAGYKPSWWDSQEPSPTPQSLFPVDPGGLQANSQFHSQGSYFKFNIIKWDWTQCIKWTRITRAARPEIHFVCP